MAAEEFGHAISLLLQSERRGLWQKVLNAHRRVGTKFSAREWFAKELASAVTTGKSGLPANLAALGEHAMRGTIRFPASAYKAITTHFDLGKGDSYSTGSAH